MLKKKERLTRTDFNRFFTTGKRYNMSSLQLIYYPHNELHASVVVSKKVARRAVERNKLRRRVYDIIRAHKQNEKLSGVYIVIVRPGAAKLTFKELKEELGGLIGRTTKTR